MLKHTSTRPSTTIIKVLIDYFNKSNYALIRQETVHEFTSGSKSIRPFDIANTGNLHWLQTSFVRCLSDELVEEMEGLIDNIIDKFYETGRVKYLQDDIYYEHLLEIQELLINHQNQNR